MRIRKGAHCRRECVEIIVLRWMNLWEKKRLFDNFETSMFNLKSLLQITDFE